MALQLPQIFSGVSVLDFSRLLPGPFATRLLMQMGAEIHCVVPPTGDALLGEYSPFEALREGKKFWPLDMKSEAGKDQAREFSGNLPFCSRASVPASWSAWAWGRKPVWSEIRAWSTGA